MPLRATIVKGRSSGTWVVQGEMGKIRSNVGRTEVEKETKIGIQGRR